MKKTVSFIMAIITLAAMSGCAKSEASATDVESKVSESSEAVSSEIIEESNSTTNESWSIHIRYDVPDEDEEDTNYSNYEFDNSGNFYYDIGSPCKKISATFSEEEINELYEFISQFDYNVFNDYFADFPDDFLAYTVGDEEEVIEMEYRIYSDEDLEKIIEKANEYRDRAFKEKEERTKFIW